MKVPRILAILLFYDCFLTSSKMYSIRFYGFTVLQFYIFTFLRFYSFTVLRFYGFTVLRFYVFL